MELGFLKSANKSIFYYHKYYSMPENEVDFGETDYDGNS